MKEVKVLNPPRCSLCGGENLVYENYYIEDLADLVVATVCPHCDRGD